MGILSVEIHFTLVWLQKGFLTTVGEVLLHRYSAVRVTPPQPAIDIPQVIQELSRMPQGGALVLQEPRSSGQLDNLVQGIQHCQFKIPHL